MKIDPIQKNDINSIVKLQPEGWSEIMPFFLFYIESPFCFPIKAVINENIIGIGCGISLNHTGWLAHVIVSPEHRNKGIGSLIVDSLTKFLNESKCVTISLIATDLGYPVYLKSGFIDQTDYVSFERNEKADPYVISNNIMTFKDEFDEVYRLDRIVSGEDRKQVLKDKMINSYLYKDNNKVSGYYMPELWEGLIIAENTEAGIELMKIRMNSSNKFTLPISNVDGMNFLSNNHFIEKKKFKRMVYGNEFQWKPVCVYHRIAGNLG